MIDFMNHEHLPETVELFNFIAELDFQCGDYFCWKSGGDGDNGEVLMNEIDEYFKMKLNSLPRYNKVRYGKGIK